VKKFFKKNKKKKKIIKIKIMNINLLTALQIFCNMQQLQNSSIPTQIAPQINNGKVKKKRNQKPKAPAPEEKYQNVLTTIPFVDRDTFETNVEKIPKIIFSSLSPYKIEKQYKKYGFVFTRGIDASQSIFNCLFGGLPNKIFDFKIFGVKPENIKEINYENYLEIFHKKLEMKQKNQYIIKGKFPMYAVFYQGSKKLKIMFNTFVSMIYSAEREIIIFK
jgi:hypothetical protein